MTENHTPPPRKAGRAALMIVAVIAAMIVAIFVGFNFYHADTLRERQSGQVDRRDGPKSRTDLQKLPALRQ
ncbi:hypothetical protein [Bosea beijingensis]|uniref:hypothetical protein n=1 Tax=Bosea beijingensis TaxID=3068632 RepID=UPI0027417558|nr:hypothetical protein [Bosea sp. REN20]